MTTFESGEVLYYLRFRPMLGQTNQLLNNVGPGDGGGDDNNDDDNP